jgi:hypothetical protein
MPNKPSFHGSLLKPTSVKDIRLKLNFLKQLKQSGLEVTLDLSHPGKLKGGTLLEGITIKKFLFRKGK